MTHVCMIAYTLYSSDQRVRREAEAVASIPGYRVTVLALKEQENPRTIEKGGVEIRELDIAKYRGKSGANYIRSYIHFTYLAFLECNRLFARRELDVVHAHNMPNFLVFAGLRAYISGKPIILDVHDTMVETYAAKFAGRSSRLLDWALRLEEAICCRMARHIISVNDIQKAAMVGRGIPEGKIVVAMNVPDPGMFDHNRTIRGGINAGGRLRMVYHGTVTKRVGVDQAIRAVSKLNGKVPGLEFHIVGDGDDLKEFQAISEGLGERDRIRFIGRVPLEGLIPILEEMDLGIVPNGRNIATELMLPVKMLECIALGIPMVAPRLKTISHYFSDDMVYFFDPDNVDSMSEAIKAASVNEEERFNKARAARRFLETYGWESHKYAFMEMYRNIMNPGICSKPLPERNGQCPGKQTGS
jgi:glycosyltransferase involved in cell wall biosynthesis